MTLCFHHCKTRHYYLFTFKPTPRVFSRFLDTFAHQVPLHFKFTVKLFTRANRAHRVEMGPCSPGVVPPAGTPALVCNWRPRSADAPSHLVGCESTHNPASDSLRCSARSRLATSGPSVSQSRIERISAITQGQGAVRGPVRCQQDQTCGHPFLPSPSLCLPFAIFRQHPRDDARMPILCRATNIPAAGAAPCR